jgi:hypothetical protein
MFIVVSTLSLWGCALSLVLELRPAFSRQRTYWWFLIALIGFMTRRDLAGVTSFVRASGLKERCYHALLGFFNGSSVVPDALARAWKCIVLRWPGIMRIRGRLVIIADGIKTAKSGRRMPGVKRLHQQSESNTKPEYISGHSCQAIGVLLQSALKTIFCVPLISRVHEGIKFTPRDQRTQLDRLVEMVQNLYLGEQFLMIADAYYASGKLIRPFMKSGNHLLCRVRGNAVAYRNPPARKKGQRGRNKEYGEKVALGSLFQEPEKMVEVDSPYDDEPHVKIRVRLVKLVWRPAGTQVLFLVAIHPDRGQFILLSTDIEMTASEMLHAYSLRFKIEVAFKQAVRSVGVFGYHFWTTAMPKLKIAGDRHFHRANEKCRCMVRRKIDAYHRFMQVGLIAQGVLQYLAAVHPDLVWGQFGSWIRTKRADQCPTEAVAAVALQNGVSSFIATPGKYAIFAKFLLGRIDFGRAEGRRFVA